MNVKTKSSDKQPKKMVSENGSKDSSVIVELPLEIPFRNVWYTLQMSWSTHTSTSVYIFTKDHPSRSFM